MMPPSMFDLFRFHALQLQYQGQEWVHGIHCTRALAASKRIVF